MSIYIQQTEVLRAMAHPVRLQIMEALLNGPACVCELMMKTGKRQACISQHLMLLRQAGLVKRTRAGHNMNYELAGDRVRDLVKCILQSSQVSCPNLPETKILETDSSNTWREMALEEIK
jgi:DNA-binding transcriptional ArsR family regulator